MNNKFLIILSLFLAFTSCRNNTAEAKKEEEALSADRQEKSEEKTTTELHLTDAQIKAIDLQVGSFEYRNLTTTLKINGKLSLPPQHQAEVSILNGGVVKSISVQEGEFVNAGKTLAIIANTEVIQLQQDYLENSANLTYLEKEYQRQKELRDEDINAGKTYQQAQRELEIAQAKKETFKSKLAQLGINANNLSPKNVASNIAITAPISGYIQHISLSIGKYADANAVLFEIVDNRYLHLDLKVFEKDLHKIKEGQQIIFSDANDITHSHPATIFSINKAFEPNEQAVLVHAKINETTETLLPGMYVEARVKINNTKAMALPTDAIVSNGDEHYIFIQTEKNSFKEIRVNIGAADMGYTEVIPIDEVSQTDKVVIKGAYYLLSELTKGSGEEE